MSPPVAEPERMSPEDFQELYGPWQPWGPTEVLEHLGGAPFPWWVAGGWAAEAGGGAARDHEDTDVAVLARDLPAVREWLGAYHLWEARQGALRPLRPGTPLTPGCEQLWVRRNAASPWVLDVLLTPTEGDAWLFKRDPRISLPLSDLGWVAPDGVPYLRPEVILLFKARLGRPKDETDFSSLVVRLGDRARGWLRGALAIAHPGHPWLGRLPSENP